MYWNADDNVLNGFLKLFITKLLLQGESKEHILIDMDFTLKMEEFE